MLGSQINIPATESSALAVWGTQYQPPDNCSRRGRPWCDHCQKFGHTKDTCWKIHGKPADQKPYQFQGEKESCGSLVSTEEHQTPTDSNPFSKEQIEVRQRMFNQPQAKPNNSNVIVGTGSLAQKGNFPSALNIKKEKISPWIVDSRALDQMTGDASIINIGLVSEISPFE